MSMWITKYPVMNVQLICTVLWLMQCNVMYCNVIRFSGNMRPLQGVTTSKDAFSTIIWNSRLLMAILTRFNGIFTNKAHTYLKYIGLVKWAWEVITQSNIFVVGFLLTAKLRFEKSKGFLLVSISYSRSGLPNEERWFITFHFILTIAHSNFGHVFPRKWIPLHEHNSLKRSSLKEAEVYFYVSVS